MSDLPEFILVIGLINNKNHIEVLNILKEYLKGIPHVKLPGCSSDIEDTYYIVPIMRNEVLQFSVYNHACDNYYEARHLFNHYMPINIKIEHDSLRDILIILED